MWWSHWPWRCSRNVWMLCWGTWFSENYWWWVDGWTGWSCGSLPTLVILWFYGSMNIFQTWRIRSLPGLEHEGRRGIGNYYAEQPSCIFVSCSEQLQNTSPCSLAVGFLTLCPGVVGILLDECSKESCMEKLLFQVKASQCQFCLAFFVCLFVCFLDLWFFWYFCVHFYYISIFISAPHSSCFSADSQCFHFIHSSVSTSYRVACGCSFKEYMQFPSVSKDSKKSRVHLPGNTAEVFDCHYAIVPGTACHVHFLHISALVHAVIAAENSLPSWKVTRVGDTHPVLEQGWTEQQHPMHPLAACSCPSVTSSDLTVSTLRTTPQNHCVSDRSLCCTIWAAHTALLLA